MIITISAYKRCSARLFLQLFVGLFVSYLCYLYMFSYSGVQHILFSVFVFSSSWIVHFFLAPSVFSKVYLNDYTCNIIQMIHMI